MMSAEYAAAFIKAKVTNNNDIQVELPLFFYLPTQ